MKQVARFADFKNLLMITGSKEYIGLGVALAVVEHNNAPRLVIDQKRAAEQGADFTQQLLKLAVIIE